MLWAKTGSSTKSCFSFRVAKLGKSPRAQVTIAPSCRFRAAINISCSKPTVLCKACILLRGTNASDVGWKAMMRPLSDFAATSALPQFALITLIVPQKTDAAWVKQLYRGLRRAASRFDIRIVGGETSSTPGPIAISVSVAGFVERNRACVAPGRKTG